MAIALSQAERQFLAKYDIGLDRVFDASGMKRAKYRVYMKAEGFIVAVGVTVCVRGHQLRDRYGICVQCRPESLTYANRFHQTLFVYVAQSRAGRMIKVGTTSDLADRFEQLNIHQYGGYADWVVLESVYCENAGRIEKQVHMLLADFQVGGDYGARPESCNELFRCKPTIALAALRSAQLEV